MSYDIDIERHSHRLYRPRLGIDVVKETTEARVDIIYISMSFNDAEQEQELFISRTNIDLKNNPVPPPLPGDLTAGP